MVGVQGKRDFHPHSTSAIPVVVALIRNKGGIHNGRRCALAQATLALQQKHASLGP